MSEYQHYEFRAIDRPLTINEQQAVASLSSRVDPHPRKAIFIYSYSDFPSNEVDIVAKYYDAMFYLANWGTKQLIFRFPSELIDIDEIGRFYVDACVTCQQCDEYVVVNIFYEADEPSDEWFEDIDILDLLIPLREDILRGDYRSLYLAWLATTKYERRNGEIEEEPDAPAGLKNLSPALEAFVDVFEVDRTDLKMAQSGSPDIVEMSEKALQETIDAMPSKEKVRWLIRLAKGEESNLGPKFRRFIEVR